MKSFKLLLFFQLFSALVKGQSKDTIIAIIPRHFDFSYFEKKINPDDFFTSKDTLYYKSYQKSKLKTSDSVIYYSNFIINKTIIFKRIKGNIVFIGSWNYESIYGKIKYYSKKGLCIVQGEINKNQTRQKIGKWLYFDKKGRLIREENY